MQHKNRFVSTGGDIKQKLIFNDTSGNSLMLANISARGQTELSVNALQYYTILLTSTVVLPVKCLFIVCHLDMLDFFVFSSLYVFGVPHISLKYKEIIEQL